MPHLLSALLGASLLSLILTSTLISPAEVAQAAPLQPAVPMISCRPDLVNTTDMAGRYVMPDMRVEVAPCGAALVFWTNDYGDHQAFYIVEDRLPDGSLLAYGYAPDIEIRAYLDSSSLLAIKPAEPGYIQVLTLRNTLIYKTYRLRKVV
jgi:hypothetical protein